MSKVKLSEKKDHKILFLIIGSFCIICVVLYIVFFLYYNMLQKTVKEESSDYMHEISKQMSQNITKNIKDNFSVLGTIGISLKNSKVTTFQKFSEVVKEQSSLWNYEKIMVVSKDGVSYDENGKKILLDNNDPYLSEAVDNRKPSMSPSQTIDGMESIVFAIPIDEIQIEDTKMVALIAIYKLETFDQILSMNIFDDNGYAHIIDKNGNMVIRSSSENAQKLGYNILNSLESAKIIGDKSLDAAKNDIKDDKSGQIEYTLDDAHEYMTYIALGSQDWYLLSFISVDKVSAKSNLMLSSTILFCSAISVLFVILLSVILTTHVRNKRRLEKIAFVDTITGGNTIHYFNQLSEKFIKNNVKVQYALIYTNIKKFKLLNEVFGRTMCDNLLSSLNHGISSDLFEDECIGRRFADNFCVLMRYTSEAELINRFDIWQKNVLDFADKKDYRFGIPTVELGIYVIIDRQLPIDQMIDRSKLALSEGDCSYHGNIRYAVYDEKVRKMLLREKHLEDRMEGALRDKEFKVYLQPKYNTKTEQVCGAEALVRWIGSEGMIYPDEFIPLFEKNGFVVKIDIEMFENACVTIRKWIDAGLTPYKISVNCSHLHLKDINFVEEYCEIADKYNVPRKYLEIEFTESTVFNDVEKLSDIINLIHSKGFGCSMDDFGSGYSSLNMIQDIPVDTLKLDKIFFRNRTATMLRTKSVVNSIISMSKALELTTVAEGVEERIQVEMLKQLDCDMIQGYYFAKPMPVSSFEELVYGKKIISDDNGGNTK